MMDILAMHEVLFPKRKKPIITARPDPRHGRIKYYVARQWHKNKLYIGSSSIGENGEFVMNDFLIKFCKQNGLWPEK